MTTRRTPLGPFQDFVRTGSFGGLLLVTSAALGLVAANGPWREGYFAFLERRLVIGFADQPLELSLLGWCNDALMALFFLLVGLEIKRELLVGELASRRRAALPIAAALGGMIVPALLYAVLNPTGPAAAGWGIPMATDIAFGLGVLTLLGPRVPLGVKVFLTALAIVDDLGAVLVIALFYTDSIAIGPALAAAAATAGLFALNLAGVRRLTPYLVLGVVLWVAVHGAGVHATIAGVLLAAAVPSHTRINAAEFADQARRLIDDFDRAETGDLLVITSKGQQEAIHALDVSSQSVQAPLLRLEHALHGPVQYLVMPLFAFVNAGVRLVGGTPIDGSAVAGVTAGLVLGKPLGITLFSWLAVRFGVASLPSGVGWRLIVAASCLGGIGFTMSLFIASLAFNDAALLASAKVGILAASAVAATLGAILIRRAVAAPSPAALGQGG